MLLRYPGGKSRGAISKRLLTHILSHKPASYSEPFFGGGAICIQLLMMRCIRRAYINDADPALANLWNRVITKPDSLSKRVRAARPSVELFTKYKNELLSGDDDGFKFLFVNRTSHGGRGVLAGPQGGLRQTGKYKIDCRWNPTRLCDEITSLHNLFRGRVTRCTSVDFTKTPEADVTYFDPPYWDVGEQLYIHDFDMRDHVRLRENLPKCFVLSYNNVKPIRQIYRDFHIEVASVGGNTQKVNSEIIITNTSRLQAT